MSDTPARSDNQTPFDYWSREHVRELASITRASRSAAQGASDFSAEDFAAADVLSVEWADGSVLHTEPQAFLAGLDERGVAATRSAARPGRVLLPFDLVGAAALTRGAPGTSRVQSYALARLTEPSTLDRVYQFGALFADGLDRWFGSGDSGAARLVAAKLCRAFETAQLDGVGPERNGALLHWRAGRWQPAEAGPAAGARDAVLFLHGTASSTAGSFSGLWEGETVGEADFQALAQRCELYAWEHRTLTVSPLRNAVELLRALAPLRAGQRLHLVSHSRGGMVGDLLALGLSRDPSGAVPQAFRQAFEQAYAPEHPDRPELERLLQNPSPALELGVFVRVASPSRGTLLADRRTDLFLSLLLRSVGLAFGTNGVPMYERLNGFVRALVAARADARSIPGLEAMMPGSALTLALNAPGLPALPGRLRVIAGDTQGLGWGGILSLVGDVFYGLHDHDFVVHTHSMFGGFSRADAKSLRLADKTVTHLSYFKSAALSRQPLFLALDGHDEGFRALREDEAITRGLFQALKPDPLARRSAAQWQESLRDPAQRGKPILLVLPGIMGSELGEVGGAPVWLSTAAMVNGALAALDLAGPRRLEPTGLTPLAYERLLVAAAKDFNVQAFAYDWREPIPRSAERLGARLDALLQHAEAQQLPLHLLAHSMGGLVARAALFHRVDAQGLLVADDARWQRLCRRGGRLLMLGTPNAGSYAPLQLLLRQHGLSKLVAGLSREVTAADLARWGAGFEGLLQMLPLAPDPQFGDLLQPVAWQGLQQFDAALPLPEPALLARARAVRGALQTSFDRLRTERTEGVFYVAGHGQTPSRLALQGESGAPQRLALQTSPQGDGTVGWDSGLSAERCWYVRASHGDLADHTASFKAYFELLQNGRSSALSRQPPQARAGAEPAFVTAAPLALPSLPEDPLAYVLGMTQRLPAAALTPRLELRVVHGSLDYARFPLIVGHYQHDRLAGGSKRVDEKLGGQLQRLIDTRLFVGADRTAMYLRPPSEQGCASAYPGALVVGLGGVGELTPGSLADTVTRAVLRYAFEHLTRDPWVPAQGKVVLRLSSLLIGTHVQAVSIRDSLAGVLNGIWRAAQIVQNEQALGRQIEIAEIEIIEIEEQAALEAAYELKRLLNREEWRERAFWVAQLLETRDGGLRGFRPGDNEGVWQRLAVRQDVGGGLKFELIAERARVESTRVYSDVASLSDYIARVSDEGAVGRSDPEEEAAMGRVLYQLLLPQNLKGRLSNFDNTVLVLDDKTATYPWELLTPPDDGLQGDPARPLAVQAGMVRQRVTDDFRSLPPPGLIGWQALVVGAPCTAGWRDARGEPLDFKPLAGARDEAEGVAEWLGGDARPWHVHKLVGETVSFERVRTALLERPYRIVHLAGHGVVDQWVSDIGAGQALRKTGMLLSHQQVLAAADVEQMDPVPEFIFINCCYSGRDGTEAEVLGQRNYPLLASSLALQFIKMGAKAVVAAGWQVNDADGLRFAEALYTALLRDGADFGSAVRDARAAIYQPGGGSNTWGAYQCYGDPAWRLEGLAGSGYGDFNGTSRLRGAEDCMSHMELSERILQVVAVAGDKRCSALLSQLKALELRLRADPLRQAWLHSSRVRAAFGEAYRELGAHDDAVKWLQLGARTAYSRVQLRHIELMVNSLARLGEERAQIMGRDILERLEAIDDPQLLWPEPGGIGGAASAASERRCLRGSVQMRRAAPAPGQAQGWNIALLAEAAQFFAAGYVDKLAPLNGLGLQDAAGRDHADRRAFALSNALLCWGLARLGGTEPEGVDMLLEQHCDWERQVRDLLDEIESLGLSTRFWHYTNTFELLVARQLLRVALAGPKAAMSAPPAPDYAAGCATRPDLQRALQLLEAALVRWPSPSEIESIQHRFRAIQAVGQAAQRTGHGPALDELVETAERALALLAAHERRHDG